MRLLDTSSGQLVVVDDPRNESYAILSHVWTRNGQGPVEQTFDDVQDILRQHNRPLCWLRDVRRRLNRLTATRSRLDNGIRLEGASWPSCSIPSALSEKIRRTCGIARNHGYHFVWVDSCCIDKSSSSELSEAINSMFSYYQNARICYAYLFDVDDDDTDYVQFRRSRWFLRGWTLQELIAPRVVVFLSRGWRVLGTKAVLAHIIEEITGIDHSILTHEASLDCVSIARRMSWAAQRRTTREEDEAYSLMGILGVNMATIYGEGKYAFIRLQEEVLKQTSDQSLFAWGPMLRDRVELTQNSFSHAIPLDDDHILEAPNLHNLLALSPRDFVSSRDAARLSTQSFRDLLGLSPPLPEYTATSHGLRTTFPLIAARTAQSNEDIFFALIACQDSMGRVLALVLRKREISHPQCVVGAFMCPTMTIEDADLHGGLLLGELYYRIVYLSRQFVAAHREQIRLRETYVLHRPERAHTMAFPGHRLMHTTLSQCLGSFELQLAGWCAPLLESNGFAVSPVEDGLGGSGMFAKRGFILRKADRTIKIEMDVCGCPGGWTYRWLRVRVSSPDTPSSDPTPHTCSPADVNEPTWHLRDHPTHVFSWSFESGMASKCFHAPYGSSGDYSVVLLTLGSVDAQTQPPNTPQVYTLGVEVIETSPMNTVIPRSSHGPDLDLSDCWIPPVTVVGSSFADDRDFDILLNNPEC